MALELLDRETLSSEVGAVRTRGMYAAYIKNEIVPNLEALIEAGGAKISQDWPDTKPKTLEAGMKRVLAEQGYDTQLRVVTKADTGAVYLLAL